jgi:hypothetical protein
MSTEVVPENVLRAFLKTYPDLFPTSDLSHLGLIPDDAFGWPIGLSRKSVKHLGGLSAVGINCASCHVAQITSTSASKPIRILGVTSHFDVEAFFGSILAATFKTSDPVNMKKFLAAYLNAEPKTFDAAWENQKRKILATIKDDPLGAKDAAPGELHQIAGAEVEPSFDEDIDLAVRAHSMLKLFHNMRTALHVPDQPPEKTPPSSGPGLGLGAPLHMKHADLEFAIVKRQTDLSEKIRPPRYPFTIDNETAKRGASLFAATCNSSHGGPESDKRLYPVAEIGTDPHRAQMFTQKLADGFNRFLAELEAEGYQPPKESGVRSTGKYFAPTLNGVWARSPYLHNGSVRTMNELLTRPDQRAKSFRRGSHAFDESTMGYADEGAYLFDTTTPGNSNLGHDYGTKLTKSEKAYLIEYLKTL